MSNIEDIRSNQPGNAGKRRFLQLAGSGIAGLSLGASSAFGKSDDSIEAVSNLDAGRRAQAYQRRLAAAREQKIEFDFGQQTNGDETAIANYAASYSKGLPHNDIGEVDPTAYQALLAALATGGSADLAKVPMGTTPPARLVNSRAGFNFSLIGQDAQGIVTPPAPAFASAQTGAEMVEAYWAAMTRDVPFSDWGSDAVIARAAADRQISAPRRRGATRRGCL